MTKEKVFTILLLIGGIVLCGMGLFTYGLFPWQLPACFIGGFMIGLGVRRLRNSQNIIDKFN